MWPNHQCCNTPDQEALMKQPNKVQKQLTSRNSCYRSTQLGIKVHFREDYIKRGGIWDRANDCVQRDFLNTLPVFNWLTKRIAPPLLKVPHWLSQCCCVVLIWYSREQKQCFDSATVFTLPEDVYLLLG